MCLVTTKQRSNSCRYRSCRQAIATSPSVRSSSRNICVDFYPIPSLPGKLVGNIGIETKRIERNGKEFLEIQNAAVDLSTSRMWFGFDNFVNDPVINEGIDRTLNDNWKDLFSEIKGDLEENIAVILAELLGPIMARIPFKEFFED